MESQDKYIEILRRHWGYEDFRGIQRDIIESIGSGHDTLGLMPTGGGKSITFQVPALAQEGTCIVVTPLIALMKDQVQHLRRQHIKATAVYSGMSHNEILIALDNCILGGYKFLYVSPERLETELFQSKIRFMKVSFITVDEAHCISQWGYDFRPSYLQIANIRQMLPHAPVLALTASATPEVVEDIERQLQFREGCRTLKMSFERKNLTYIVRHTNDKWRELLSLLSETSGSTIIYTRNRKQTHEIAEALNASGISATNYHAGLPQVDKDERQEQWQRDKVRVMVATNAFGMGIDKPDVRQVIHVELPDSPEAYFQEAGRAGRDGEPAFAVLLYTSSDGAKLLRRVAETYPEPDHIRQVYEHVCFYLQIGIGEGFERVREFNLQEFCYRFHYFPVDVRNCLVLLSNAGYIDYTEDDEVTSRLIFTVTRNELYSVQGISYMQEKILRTIMRSYTGVFAEMAYIDEYQIAHDTNLSVNEVYFSLKELSHRHVVDYVPRKRTNHIRFTQCRIEKEEIRLSAQVYADRRNQYEHRITRMLEYVTNRDVCHSRFLLEYFGEPDSHECGRCDVCRNLSEPEPAESELISASIRRQLAMKGSLLISEFDTTGFSRDTFASVLSDMVRQELLTIDSCQRISKK